MRTADNLNSKGGGTLTKKQGKIIPVGPSCFKGVNKTEKKGLQSETGNGETAVDVGGIRFRKVKEVTDSLITGRFRIDSERIAEAILKRN